MTIAEATAILQGLFETPPQPPPLVRAVKAHVLNETDPIFKSFQEDYPDFNSWLRKCKRQHRQTWVIDADATSLAAVAIVKKEEPGEFGLPGKVLKLASFKVSEQYSGLRFGELLLKAIFDYARENRFDRIYVTIFEKHSSLITLLEDFGFQGSRHRTELGELVLVKNLSYTPRDLSNLDPLTFNVSYGPFAVKFHGVSSFVVPIKPRYHRLLFPEAEQQWQLIPQVHPFSNSIRKAYLCNASIRKITPGSALFFYRSGRIPALTCLGVVEGTLVSSSPEIVARYVGKRTVYRFSEIRAMCRRPVLAILFRQSRVLRPPIKFKELRDKRALSSPPQSIVKLRQEGVEWLQTRLSG